MKRLLAMAIALSMLLTLMSPIGLPVSFAAGEDTDISDMNALEALGIDPSEVPEGVDLNSLDNPYGRETSTVNPTYELFVQGGTTSTLYGHNKQVNQPWEEFYDSQADSRTTVVTGAYAATATVSGNFTEDDTGARAQTVTVAAGALNANGGLYLYFSDPVNDKKGNSIELLGTSKTIGNTGNQMDEPFGSDSYLMQNYLQIASGDFDGDGVDEVAVYVAQQGSSRVEIYDLQVDDTFTPENAATYYLDTTKWAKAWTYYFNESPYVSNMVSLTAGDFNRDGTDDLALTWGYYYGPDKYTNSKAVILCGSKNSMLQKSMNISLAFEDSQIVRAAFTYGDIDGDNVDDLILGGQLNKDITGGNLYSRFVAVYTYDGENDRFVQSIAKNFDLFSTEENDAGEEVYVYPVMADHNDIFYSLPTMVANVAAVNMRGMGYAANIYIDSLVLEYGDEGLDIIAALDQNLRFNIYRDYTYPTWVRTAKGRFYTEYGLVSADFTGNTAESLQVMLYYSAENYTTEVTYEVPYYRNWWFDLWGIEDWTTVTEVWSFAEGAATVMAAVEGELTENVDPTSGAVTGYDFNISAEPDPVPFATSFCELNSDNDTAFVSYTGEHGVIYTDPEVMAILASPPYFEDLSSDQLSGSYMESATSFSKTVGDGTEESTSNTLSIGAYVSWEHDFEVFGVKVAGMETELSYSHGWTWETSESSMMEMTVSYETVAGQDSVVFYSIPMEYYIYDSYVPIIDEATGQVTGYDLQKMSVNLPHTAAVVVLSLEKYEKIAADYDELPPIAGTVLTHTVGDPSTYPDSKAGYNNAIEYSGNWAGVDYSAIGASVSQEIAISSENSSGLTHTNTVDFQIGAGPGDFIFGVTAGYEHGSGRVTVTSEGSTYSGTVYNMPAEAEEHGYYYAWKLFTYTETIGQNIVPVVNYMVKDVTSPPTLPEDFAQDSTLTTDEAIGLTWSYPSNAPIAGFQLYRYYEFPDGSGSYELAFVPASDVSYVTEDAGGALIRHYRYVNTGLADYTDYKYQIQAIRSAVPPTSILSDVLTARTKADKGYPTITLNGVSATTTPTFDEESGLQIGNVTEYSLLVYPDTSSTVSVAIAESYAQTPRYQWQKLTDAGWVDIAGSTTASHTFSSSGVSDEGEYRCRLNVIYEDEAVGQIYYNSAYSDAFTLDYSKRTPQNVGFAADTSSDTVSLALKSAHTNHTFAPSGNVTFSVRGADYSSSYTVALGSASGDYTTTATLDLGTVDSDGDGVAVNLPEGVYEITAFYSGSRVFGSLAVADPIYYVSGDGSGYLLNVDSVFTYGDNISPQLMSVTEVDGAVQTNEVSTGVTYKVYKEQVRTVTVSYPIHYWWFPSWEYWVTYTYAVHELVECPDFILPDGSVTARSAGVFELRALVDGTEVARREMSVRPKSIVVHFNYPFEGESGSVAINHPTSADLQVTPADGLEYTDTLENLGIVVKAYNTAGTEVTISSSTDPGIYTIVGAPGAASSSYGNYSILYTPSTYTLTGPRYDMTLVSKVYGADNAIVGTAVIVSPEIKENDGTIVNPTTTATNNTYLRSGAFMGGTAVSLRATPQTGYMVKSWTVATSGTSATTSTTSTSHTLTTTANDTTVTVEFQLARNRLFFQSASGGTTDGTVTPVGTSILSGAVVQPGATYTFKAMPAAGYHFVEWTLAGSTNQNFLGDYDALTGTSTATITMGSVDTVLSAVFERNSYLVTLEGELEAQYEVDDGFGNMVSKTSTGSFSVRGDTSVVVGPKTGYSLSDSAAWYVNDTSIGTGLETYTFTVTGDTAISVGTAQNTYEVSVSVLQPTATTHNAVTVKVDNVTTDFSAPRTVAGGKAISFTAVPAWGYVFDHWKVNGVASGNSLVYTIPALGQTTSVVAVFVDNPSVHTVSVSNNAGGCLTYSVVYDGTGYSGNAPTGASVTATGADITVYGGDTVIFTAIPDANYMLRSWTVGDVVDESPDTELILPDISQDKVVSARFIAMSFTTVTYTAGVGGAITSATSDGVAFASGDIIGNGTEVILTAVPEAGKMVSHWTLDGVTVDKAGATFIGETLTIESLSAGNSAEITVTFVDLVEHAVVYTLTNVSANRIYTPATYTNKTVSAGNTDYVRDGSKAVITVEPDSGYRITDFTVGGVSGTENVDGTWSFTVDWVSSSIDVVATAARLYAVSVDSSLVNGSITVQTEEEEGLAIAGEIITLATIEPDLDYTFGGWSCNGTAASGTTFLMPAEDVSVSATFTAIDAANISYSVYDTNGAADGGTNGSISAVVNRVYSTGETVSGYPVTDIDGTLTVNRGYADSYVIWPDSTVTLNAAPAAGYMTKYWYVNGVQVTSETPDSVMGANSLSMTISQGSLDTYSVQVQYELIGDKITYSSEDSYGTITSAILTSAFGESTSISSGHTLTISGTITFTAVPVSDDYQVEGWYVNGLSQEGQTGATFIYTATAGVGAVVTARFERVSYTVTYGGENGVVTAAISEVPVGDSPALVVGDSAVKFTATANPGYAFSGWMVGGVASDVTTVTLTLPITANTTVEAVFEADENCPVTFGVTGSGGTLSATRDGFAFVSGNSAAANDVVIFTATAETIAAGGTNNYRVKSWTVNGVTTVSHATSLELTVSAALSVAVVFERTDYVVTYGVSAGNGTLSGACGLTAIGSGDRVAAGGSVTFTATPAAGYQVKSWTVGPDLNATEEATYTVDSLNEDIEVSVEFEPVPAYTVTITTSGTGYGSVTARVGDGEVVDSATSVTVPRHGTVTLTAKRYDTSNAFNGWTVPASSACMAEPDGIVLVLSDVTGNVSVDAAFVPATMVELSASETDPNGTLNYNNVQVGYLSADLMNTVDLSSSSSVQITSGMDVVIVAVPNPGYMVREWTVNGVPQDELSSTLTLKSVDGDTAIEVSFEPVVTHSIPGSGDQAYRGYYVVTPGLKVPDDVGSGSVIRDRGTITFNVAANEGCYLSTLNINGVNCLIEAGSGPSVTENAVSVVRIDDGSYNVTVTNVTANVAYAITAIRPVVNIVPPANGTIVATWEDASGVTHEATSGTEVPVGAELTITATAEAGYYFRAWGGDMLGKTGTQISVTVTEQESITVFAEFAHPVVTVSVPLNGSIVVTHTNLADEKVTLVDTSSALDGVPSVTFAIPAGTRLVATATAEIDYVFRAWGGAADGLSGSTITLLVPGNDINISASFRLVSSGGGGGIPGGGGGIFPPSVDITTDSNLNPDGSVTLTTTVAPDPAVLGQRVTVSLDDDDAEMLLAEIIGSEEEAGSTDLNSSVVIDASVEKDVTRTLVEIPGSALSSIVDETSANVTVVTNTAQVVFDRSALSAIADDAHGSLVTISVEEVDRTTLSQAVQDAIGDAYVLDLAVEHGWGAVEDFAGGTATVRVPVPAEMIGKGMKVVFIADDGTITEMTGATVVIDGVEYFEFTTSHFSYYALVEDGANLPFTDVLPEDWHHGAVAYAYRNNLMTGMSATEFGPNATTTRAMLVTVLWRLTGEPSAVSSTFTDVPSGQWYSSAVSWASENAIVNGMGGGLFAPNSSITREQMAVILFNYARFMGYDASVSGDTSTFIDGGAVSAWAIDGMKWAVGTTLLSGKGGGILDSQGTATRAEVATVLMRFIENIAK